MRTDDIFYQIFQTSPAIAFELMGETPPCEYEFRAQEVKLLVELATRIFPELSQEEIKRMLELVPVRQTRFYRDVQEEQSRSLVLRQLSRCFGEIPPNIQTQIEQLNLEQTESLAEALLDFTSLEDLLTWLEQSSQD